MLRFPLSEARLGTVKVGRALKAVLYPHYEVVTRGD